MRTFIVPVLSIKNLTHDVFEIRTEKPAGYLFEPGQATEVAINRDACREMSRPFTFTSVPSDNFLEFIIKVYPQHNGMTRQLTTLNNHETLIIGEPWGAISYKGTGLFIAGGAGITPFISIFRQLAREKKLSGNKLIFANKTHLDIILENELNTLLPNDIMHILSNDVRKGYVHGFVNAKMIEENRPDRTSKIYLCGPPPMMDAVMLILKEIGVNQDSITVEI